MKARKIVLMLFAAVLSIAPMGAQERALDMRADRAFIYPDRLELTGEETLLDVLLMYPDLMQSGWAEMIGSYNLRIDNSPINGDTRIVCSQIKAKHISRIQVCDNTAVAKGTIGMGRVIDINMKRYDQGVHGVAGVQAATDNLLAAHAEARVGSAKTDVYATASYAHTDDDAEGNNQYLSAHMTNWFGPRDKLLTYFTQQYITADEPAVGGSVKSTNEKYMARARYFHTFNDAGTELLTVFSYQYTNSPKETRLATGTTVADKDNTYLIGIVELNTPLCTGLSMMAGWEGDFSFTETDSDAPAAQASEYSQMNNDAYLQFNYLTGMWRFTVGDRVMFYRYASGDHTHTDVRNNIEASIIASVSERSQVQAAYHRKFTNPSFAVGEPVSDSDWLLLTDGLTAAYIDDAKLAYTYSRRNLMLSAGASYLKVDKRGTDDRSDVGKLYASAYCRLGALQITAGINGYAESGSGNDYATFTLAPKLTLPCEWMLSGQAVFASGNKTLAYGEDTYLALQLSKNIGEHWSLLADWHDISSSDNMACMATVKYRF